MTEEISKTFTCDGCKRSKKVDLGKGMFGVMRNPSAPKGWTKRNNTQFCHICAKTHDDDYQQWFKTVLLPKLKKMGETSGNKTNDTR